LTEAASTTQLSIALLGNPIIEWNGVPLAISRRATRTLLYYLASENKSVGRDKLCFLFWPDQDEKDARNNLRGLISKLRKALPLPNGIVSYNDQLTLDASLVRIDKLEFETLYGAIGTSPFVYPDNLPQKNGCSILMAIWSIIANCSRNALSPITKRRVKSTNPSGTCLLC